MGSGKLSTGQHRHEKGHRDFRAQHPYLVPATALYTAISSKHEPVPPVTGQILPLTLLLAQNKAKPTQTALIRNGAEWHIPEHQTTTQDLPAVLHDSKHMPRTCWTCDPKVPPHHAPITAHSTLPHPPHGPPTSRGLTMADPVVPPCRHEPHSGVKCGPQTPMPIHHNAHLAPPRSRRNCNPLQHARTGQIWQARAPLLSTPPLVLHARTPNKNPHMPKPEPGHSLHPPLHPLLPHTRTTRTGTHSRVPPAGNASSPKE